MTTTPLPATPSSPFSPTATWYIALVLASAAGIVLGLLWDISWHMTIGRDTFWSPPHMLEYASGLTAGLVSGFVVLRTTLAGSPDDRGATVRFWGFRGPLGAWITIWGTFAMLVSAPFDNWWHNAYGLDVKIVSPPHMVLFLGMLGIVLGALVLTAAAQNRSAGRPDMVRDAWLYAVAGGVLCLIFGAGTLEYSWPNQQHGQFFYVVWGGVFPLLLAGYARAGRLRWPATAAALAFMVIWFALAQVLRQVDATPHLAPVWNPRTYLWPMYFPVMLVVPAFGIDVVRRLTASRPPWVQALLASAAFVVLLALVQWPMATFMLGPGSRNWFFNGHEWPYFSRLGSWEHSFWEDESAPGYLTITGVLPGLAVAAVVGTLSSRLGIAWGRWMASVRR